MTQVGLELRELLAAVDRLIPAFPQNTHRQVEIIIIIFNIIFIAFVIIRWRWHIRC